MPIDALKTTMQTEGANGFKLLAGALYLHTCTPAHLHTCTPTHLHTYTPAHLLTCSPAHLITCSPAHLITCTPAHLHTSTPAHLHTCNPAHLHTCCRQGVLPRPPSAVARSPGGRLGHGRGTLPMVPHLQLPTGQTRLLLLCSREGTNI